MGKCSLRGWQENVSYGYECVSVSSLLTTRRDSYIATIENNYGDVNQVYNTVVSLGGGGGGGHTWVHLHPIHAPVHPSCACIVLLFTYSLSQYACFITLSQPVIYI